MTNGKDLLTGIPFTNEIQKQPCSAEQGLLCLNIIGPRSCLQVGNVMARERTPVTLAQQRCGVKRQTVGLGHEPCGLDGTVKVTRHNGIYRLTGKLTGQLPGLTDPFGGEFSLCLSLYELSDIVDGLAMAS